MSTIFSKSDSYKEEYSCRVVRIGQVIPIAKSKYLATTLIGDSTVVVRKSEVHEGDLFFYVGRECVLPSMFLHKNNLYMFDKYELNSNAEEVRVAVAEAEKYTGKERDERMMEAKRLAGFFGEKGRVRSAKLQGVYSHGFIFTQKELVAWRPELTEYFETHSLEEFEGEYFDTIDGCLFCYAYVPGPAVTPKKKPRKKTKIERKVEKYFGWLPKKYQYKIIRKFQKPKRKLSKKEKRIARLKYFDANNFEWHYDTNMLGNNIWKFNPKTVVTISPKIHGTSAIYANTLRPFPYENIPKSVLTKNKWIRRLHLPKSWIEPETYDAYDYIYSTRNVIQNKDMNPSAKVFDDMDVYKSYYDMFKKLDCLPHGMIVYGEIFGFDVRTGKGIQGKSDAPFDYGCAPNTNKFMPYRISTKNEDGSWKEWNVVDVVKWTERLVSVYPELKDMICVLDILYHGTLEDLYPELDTNDSHWHENVLRCLKNEKRFHMEEDEPLCVSKVPREGICVRIDDDAEIECFKLKTDKFYEYEDKAMKAGVVDVEMVDEYGPGDSDESDDTDVVDSESTE